MLAEAASPGFQAGSAGFHAASEQGDWLPSGFQRRRTDGAILYETESGKPAFLCSRLVVEAATRTAESADWGLLLRVQDRDGSWHEWAMPKAELAGSGERYRKRLLSMGLELAPGNEARKALHQLLSTAKPQRRARCVGTLGWHDGAYLLPEDEVIGERGSERLVLQTTEPLDHNLRVRGSLEGWREAIGRLAAGNTRLVVAVAVAFAAPMLRALGIEGGGLHFRGSSSIGKTTVAEVAGSVCGGGQDGYMSTWRATDNALEAVAAAHNDGLVVLDEIGQVDPNALGKVAYMLANGQGKRRMSRDGIARPVLTWRLLFVSTGEVSLADKIAEGRRGARVMAGQEVRVLDLPADAGAGHGVFDVLHGFATGQALADHLKASVQLHYGHPLRAFVRRLVEESWESGARASIKRFVSEVVPAGADGQVRRAAQRFAVIAVAGELAARWGILPLPEGEATKAAARLFDEWLAARGGHEPAEIAAGIADVHRFVDRFGSTRFVPWDDPARPVAHCAGFVRPGPDGPTYYVLPGAWREDILKGHDARLISRELVRRGMLKSTGDGKPQRKERLPDGTERRVYVLLPAFLSAGER